MRTMSLRHFLLQTNNTRTKGSSGKSIALKEEISDDDDVPLAVIVNCFIVPMQEHIKYQRWRWAVPVCNTILINNWKSENISCLVLNKDSLHITLTLKYKSIFLIRRINTRHLGQLFLVCKFLFVPQPAVGLPQTKSSIGVAWWWQKIPQLPTESHFYWPIQYHKIMMKNFGQANMA